MKWFLAAVSVVVVSACGVQTRNSNKSSSVEAANSSKGMIQGDDANALIGALLQIGVKLPDNRVGALHLEVKQITCGTPVVPNPKSTCQLVIKNQKTIDSSDANAQIIAKVLMKNGALIQDRRVGSANVEAKNVVCSRVVRPGAKGTCTFTKH